MSAAQLVYAALRDHFGRRRPRELYWRFPLYRVVLAFLSGLPLDCAETRKTCASAALRHFRGDGVRCYEVRRPETYKALRALLAQQCPVVASS